MPLKKTADTFWPMILMILCSCLARPTDLEAENRGLDGASETPILLTGMLTVMLLCYDPTQNYPFCLIFFLYTRDEKEQACWVNLFY
jgi:hypothetical protein